MSTSRMNGYSTGTVDSTLLPEPLRIAPRPASTSQSFCVGRDARLHNGGPAVPAKEYFRPLRANVSDEWMAENDHEDNTTHNATEQRNHIPEADPRTRYDPQPAMEEAQLQVVSKFMESMYYQLDALSMSTSPPSPRWDCPELSTSNKRHCIMVSLESSKASIRSAINRELPPLPTSKSLPIAPLERSQLFNTKLGRPLPQLPVPLPATPTLKTQPAPGSSRGSTHPSTDRELPPLPISKSLPITPLERVQSRRSSPPVCTTAEKPKPMPITPSEKIYSRRSPPTVSTTSEKPSAGHALPSLPLWSANKSLPPRPTVHFGHDLPPMPLTPIRPSKRYPAALRLSPGERNDRFRMYSPYSKASFTRSAEQDNRKVSFDSQTDSGYGSCDEDDSDSLGPLLAVSSPYKQGHSFLTSTTRSYKSLSRSSSSASSTSTSPTLSPAKCLSRCLSAPFSKSKSTIDTSEPPPSFSPYTGRPLTPILYSPKTGERLEGITGLKEAIALKMAITEETKPLIDDVADKGAEKAEALLSCKFNIFGSNVAVEVSKSPKTKAHEGRCMTMSEARSLRWDV